MKIQTTRFGELEVDKKDVITFKDGILGFETLKNFFIVDPGDQTLILWLQSTEEKTVAFPVIEPKIFKPDYSVKLMPIDFASLELDGLDNASVYTILTIPQNVLEMSGNLKAPIVINNKSKYAKQIVLQDSKLEVRYMMYNDLKKYIVNFNSDDTRRTKIQLAEPEKTVTQETKTEIQQTTHTKELNT